MDLGPEKEKIEKLRKKLVATELLISRTMINFSELGFKFSVLEFAEQHMSKSQRKSEDIMNYQLAICYLNNRVVWRRLLLKRNRPIFSDNDGSE